MFQSVLPLSCHAQSNALLKIDTSLLEPFNAARHAINPADDSRVQILPFTHSPARLFDLPKLIPQSKVTLETPPDGGPAIAFVPSQTEIKSVFEWLDPVEAQV
jgi:hypothetical protein